MLTPVFELKQDSDTVFLTIKAPYTNVSTGYNGTKDSSLKISARNGQKRN